MQSEFEPVQRETSDVEGERKAWQRPTVVVSIASDTNSFQDPNDPNHLLTVGPS